MNSQKLLILALSLLAALSLASAGVAAPTSQAAQTGKLDTSFDPGDGVDDIIFAIDQLSDSKILIGGQFLHVDGAEHTGIARLNAGGAVDPAYTPTLAGAGYVGLTSIAVQSNDKAIIAGAFTHVNFIARNNIARLNTDGSLDSSYAAGGGVTGGAFPYVNTLCLVSGGGMLVGGSFTHVDGTARNNIARLTSAGGLDAAFDPGDGSDGEVFAIAVQQSTNKVIIGGAFENVDNAEHHHLARLNANGSLDGTFNTNVDGDVLTLLTYTNGKILIGGSFTHINGIERKYIARLNADGTLDTTFVSDLNGDVEKFLITKGGKIVIGGKFTQVGKTTRVHIARLVSDGALDASFNPGLGAIGGAVYALKIQTDGKLLIGGNFTTYDTTPIARIARLWGDFSIYLPLVMR